MHLLLTWKTNVDIALTFLLIKWELILIQRSLTPFYKLERWGNLKVGFKRIKYFPLEPRPSVYTGLPLFWDIWLRRILYSLEITNIIALYFIIALYLYSSSLPRFSLLKGPSIELSSSILFRDYAHIKTNMRYLFVITFSAATRFSEQFPAKLFW